MKRVYIFLVLVTAVLLLPLEIPADSFDPKLLLERLSEEGKLPENSAWSEALAEALAAEGEETRTLHPLTLSIIAGSLPGFTDNEDPAAAGKIIAETMRDTDRQIRKGVPQSRIRRDIRHTLSNNEAGPSSPSSRGGAAEAERRRGRETARAILEALDNPGRGNRPFSSIPGMKPEGSAVPGQGPSIPENRENPGNSENAGDENRPDRPF